ncbi:MAG TPA: hypothetical protein VFA65_18810 [Bryobacteraceae bacterium]|nr:hypothetical protein [Bryobacteraceae bacterium]
MTHLTEQELIDAYYNDAPSACREHLDECAECRDQLARLSELLDGVRDVPIPSRGEGYGREVWARLEPRLPIRKTRWWTRSWVLVPAALTLLVAAFVGGMLTVQRHQTGATQQIIAGTQPVTGISEKDRQRILLAALGDHLDRSEILLVQLLNSNPGDAGLGDQRARARDLLEENRLLRESAFRSGDQAHAALLDDLERVFVDLANSPSRLSSEDVAGLRQRIENQGLLFKVRVTNTDTRSKGQTL